jgi:D-arabinose 1-dehydrogenase-like Zn-dependent alcohol dehydrogenase
MLSWQIIEHGKPLQKQIHETPRPRGTEVLVRVTRSGVCHSDVHIWEGYFDLGGGKRFYVKERGCVPPFTMGHEPFGIVEALGSAVSRIDKKIRPGQKRLVYPWIGCGKCEVCKSGQDNYCLTGRRFLGVDRAGAYSTHLLVPHPKYLIDAGDIDDSFAATLACSALTAYSAARKVPALGSRDWVAAIGCGGVGLSGISVLRARGLTNLIARDIDPAKLAAASKLGAGKTLDIRAPDSVRQLQALAGGSLACAIDFVGMPATAALGMSAVKKGGRYVICGLMGGELVYPLPNLVQRALTLVGSHVGNLQELREVVALAKQRKLRPMPLETRPASEASRALEDLKAGSVLGRIVLDFEALTA